MYLKESQNDLNSLTVGIKRRFDDSINTYSANREKQHIY